MWKAGFLIRERRGWEHEKCERSERHESFTQHGAHAPEIVFGLVGAVGDGHGEPRLLSLMDSQISGIGDCFVIYVGEDFLLEGLYFMQAD